MTSYEVVTQRGVTTFTFDTASAAREYCLKMKAVVPGLSVVEVTTTVERRRIYTPRTAQGRAA
jgi:hypothetical protein